MYKAYIIKKSYIDITPFREILNKYNISIVDNYLESDFLILCGGDGITLSGVNNILQHDVPILAVNYGKLGYLSNIYPDEFERAIMLFLKGEYTIDNRKLLEINVNDEVYYALNELCIIKQNIQSKIIQIKVEDITNDPELVNRYRADGLLVSTPTGSTAYSLSCGGPILHKNIDCIVLTAIAPQNLTSVPIVMNGDSVLRYTFDENYRKTSIHIDGHIHIDIDENTVITTKLSSKAMRFLNISNISFYEILRKKLHWGENIIN